MQRCQNYFDLSLLLCIVFNTAVHSQKQTNESLYVSSEKKQTLLHLLTVFITVLLHLLSAAMHQKDVQNIYQQAENKLIPLDAVIIPITVFILNIRTRQTLIRIFPDVLVAFLCIDICL